MERRDKVFRNDAKNERPEIAGKQEWIASNCLNCLREQRDIEEERGQDCAQSAFVFGARQVDVQRD
jgi:hypothetical protein